MSRHALDRIRCFKQIYLGRLKPLGLDKDEREADYFRRNKYRFIHTLKTLDKFYRPGRILDIGPTPFTLCLKEIFDYAEISALDISDKWKSRLEPAGIRLEVADLSQGRLPFAAESFEMVIFSEVIEHLPQGHAQIIRELRRVLKNKGILILSTFNAKSLRNILFAQKPGHPVVPYPGDAGVCGHVKEYTLRQIRGLLKAGRFRILKEGYAGYFDRLGLYYISTRLHYFFRQSGNRRIFSLIREGLIRIAAFPFLLGYLAMAAFVPSLRMGLFFVAEATGTADEH